MTAHRPCVPPALHRLPSAGEVLHIDTAASVQFAVPIRFRVIRVLDRSTYAGWTWLRGYELSPTGDAIAQRDIWVQIHGLRWISTDDPR